MSPRSGDSGKYNPQHTTAQCDEPPIVSLEERELARRTVAVHARRLGIPDEEAVEMIRMLGIFPGEEDPYFITGPAFLQTCEAP